MIEIIYNKEKESAVGNEEYFCIPRNIRQIGQPSKDCKIYVEDYVYAYLSKRCMESEEIGRVAILLGTNNWKDGTFYIFIKSCLIVDDANQDKEYLAIKDDVWGKIYEEMKRCFPGQEVIGWYIDRPGGSMIVTDQIKRVHLTHFGGNDKVLYLADTREQDNAFFMYKNGKLERQMGYYIFYERNEPMQDYILEKSPGVSVDYTGKPQDLAVNDFRKIIAKKRAEKETKKADKVFRAATTAAAVAFLVLSVLWVQKTPLGTKVLSVLKDEDSGRNTTIEAQQQEKTEDANEDMLTEIKGNAAETLENSSNNIEETVESMQNEADNMEETSDDTQTAAGDTEETSNVMGPMTNFTEYTIRQGDTLCGISVRYYGDLSKVDEICKINSMTKEDIIYEGQKILLP